MPEVGRAIKEETIMARGNFYEVSLDSNNIGNMTEEDFYGSNEGDYFEDSLDSSVDINALFNVLNSYGIKTGQGEDDGLYYAIFTETGKENWFRSQFLELKTAVESMDLKTFSTTSMYKLKKAICDYFGDAIYLDGALYPLDEFIREAECDKKYYFGNVVLAH